MTPTDAPERVALEDVDLLDPAWFEHGPPHELFRRMRAEAPIRWNGLADGTGFWSVTRHADVSAISRDTATYSSWRSGVLLQPDAVLPLDVNRSLLLYKDPPEHTKYRLILQTAFTPNTVAKLEDAVRARVTQVIDRFVEDGEADLTAQLAVPVPLAVLADLMGLPESDIPRLHEWTDGIEEAQRAGVPALELFGGMAAYLHEQVQRQAAEGRADSLVMRLREAEVDGHKLDDAEILVFFGLLVFAGNDTTVTRRRAGCTRCSTIPTSSPSSSPTRASSRAPSRRSCAGRPWVNYFVRTVTKDTELSGQPFAEGEKVVIWYTSASRDEAVFEDPDRFDIHRGKSDHKAFGGGGRHSCLGAGLARLELRIILEEVTRRLAGLERAGGPEWRPSPWANMVHSLPVRFTPGAREG